MERPPAKFEGWDLRRFLGLCRELAIPRVELLSHFATGEAEDPLRGRTLLAEYGTRAACFSVSNNFGDPEAKVAAIVRGVEMAQDEEPLATVRRLAPLARHIHLKKMAPAGAEADGWRDEPLHLGPLR